MADIINEGDSKLEVVDSSTDSLAKIIAEINGELRIEQTATNLRFYNPNDQMETGDATDDQNGAASSFNGFQVENGVLQIQSGDGSSVPESNLYIDGKSIISDKTLAIGTTGQKELHFGTNGTKWVKITEGGHLDFGKMSIGGSQGTAGQFIRNAGNGTIEWATIDSNNAFGTISIGATDLDAGSVGDSFTITAGDNITLTPDSSTNTLTIAASQPNVFSTISVSGQDDITLDQASDTLNFAGGTGISITTDATTDTITITNTGTSSGSTEDVFKNIAVADQPTISADSSTDTLTFIEGSGIKITTDDSSDSVTFKNDATRLLSKLGYFSFTYDDGTTDEMPLRNFFINKTYSGGVNGGGTSVGMATRAIRMLESDSSTYSFMVMPANSAGDSLTFTFTQSDGTLLTKDVTMAA